MYNLNKLILILSFSILFSNINFAQFSFLEGDAQFSRVYQSKIINDHIFILGYMENQNGFVQKKDMQGNTSWQIDLASDFLPRDIAVISDTLVVVGHSRYFDFSTNSKIASIKDLGSTANLIAQKELNHEGREQFTQIINNPNNPYTFIVQHFYPGDDVMVIEFDKDLNIVSNMNYDGGDDQYWLGLRGDQATMTLTGNMGGFSSGCYVELNNDFTVNKSYSYSNVSTVYDYLDRDANRKILVGFTTNSKGALFQVDANGDVDYSIEFLGTRVLRFIEFESHVVTPDGFIETVYIRGDEAALGNTFVMKLEIVNTNGVYTHNLIYAKTIEEGSTNMIHTTFDMNEDYLVFADARSGSQDSYGNYDLLISITDHDMNVCNVVDKNYVIQDLNIVKESFSISTGPITLPALTDLQAGQINTFSSVEICTGCVVANIPVVDPILPVESCGNTFDLSTITIVDSNPNTNGQTGSKTYHSIPTPSSATDNAISPIVSNGTYYIRLEVNGCYDIVEVEVNTPITAFEINCPADLVLSFGSSTDTSSTGVPSASGGCSGDGAVTISYTDNVSSIAFYSVIVRTWTASDIYGNTVSCNQTIQVEEFEAVNSTNVWIESVDLTTLSNTSGNDGGFGNYSNLSASIEPDVQHLVSLSPGYLGADVRVYWRIYIDYNQNGIFEHGGERAVQISRIGDLTKTFNVPPNIDLGSTKMRIIASLGSYQLPYGGDFEGEVEDYGIDAGLCDPITDGGVIDGTQQLCNDGSSSLDPGLLGNVQDATGGSGALEYQWFKNVTLCDLPDGTNNWIEIVGATSATYDPPTSTSTAVYIRGARNSGCQDYVYSNIIDILVTEDCVPDCASAGGDTSSEYIYRFKFGNLNNISGDDGGYGDYTSMSGAADQGQNVTYQLRPKFIGGSHLVHWRVWVDWNEDGFFSDLCEKIIEVSSSHTNNGTFKIPSGVPVGTKKIRVAMNADELPSPCGDFNLGEVEDYTFDVLLNTSPIISEEPEGNEINTMNPNIELQEEKLDQNKLMHIYPNPTKESFTIHFNEITKGSIVLRNHLGQMIYELDLVGNSNVVKIDFHNLGIEEGVYFLSYHNAREKITKKIFVIE